MSLLFCAAAAWGDPGKEKKSTSSSLTDGRRKLVETWALSMQEKEGFRRRVTLHHSLLEAGSKAALPLQFLEGLEYSLAVVGQEEMEVRLLDGEGREVAAPASGDGIVLIRVQPEKSGIYSLEFGHRGLPDRSSQSIPVLVGYVYR